MIKNNNKLIEQIAQEYSIAYDNINTRLQKQLKRLKLYNNQMRDAKRVGDPLMFTIIDSFTSSHYEDKPMTIFEGRGIGDDEMAENLNSMYEFDYDQMNMDKLRYYWLWDTVFFGKGYVLLYEFNEEAQHPVPELLDPMTFLVDPSADSIDSARFLGWEGRMTRRELELNENYYNISSLNLGGIADSLIDQARREREGARGTNNSTDMEVIDLGDNAEFRVLHWMTHFEGKKVFVTLGNDGKVMVRDFTIYDPQNEDIGLGVDQFPIIERSLFPIGHEFYGVSIPDLVEDKQRMKSILLNLGIELSKADLYGGYIYDKMRIKNRADLNFGMNKHIGVDGDPGSAVVPRMTKRADLGQLDLFLQSLDAISQRATATPEMQQGAISEQERTASELNLVAARIDVRYNKVAKVFGWADKRFARQWYLLYKVYFAEDVNEKMIRLNGVLGNRIKTLKREDIISTIDPDVRVIASSTSKAQRIEKLQAMSTVMQFASQLPDVNMRFAVRKLAELSGMELDEVNLLVPPNADELRAEEENVLLDQNEIPEVLPSDNHQAHILIHAASLDTPATFAHVETHKKAIAMKQENPELFPSPEGEGLGAEGEMKGKNPQEEGDRFSKLRNVMPG